MKILIDFSLDGYDSEEEMKKASLEFVQDQLDIGGTNLTILEVEGEKYEGN